MACRSKAHQDSYEWTRTMLRYGGNPNTCYMDGMTPFLLCVESNSFEEVLLHLSFKATISSTNLHGETVLHLAVKNSQNPDVLEQMLRFSQLSVHAQTKLGFTPLHYAVSYGYPNACTSLLRRGAMLNAKCKDGNTPLALALKRQAEQSHRGEPQTLKARRKEVVEILLRQLAIMVHSGLLIDESDVQLIEGSESLGQFYAICSKELSAAKHRVYYKNTTLFDLLVFDLDIILQCVKNDGFVNAFQFVQKKNFPLYYAMLCEKFEIAMSNLNNNSI